MNRGFCARIIVDLDNPKWAKQRFCQYLKYTTCCYFVHCNNENNKVGSAFNQVSTCSQKYIRKCNLFPFAVKLLVQSSFYYKQVELVIFSF